MLRGLFARLRDARRKELIGSFFKLMRPSPDEICLEVGGPTLGFEQVADYFGKNYLVLNLQRQDVMSAAEIYSTSGVQRIQGDATAMPFCGRSVDYVFSNATLEHIPRTLRFSFAKEVVRITKRGFFVAAPNYWFPLEPHYRLPLFQFLPEYLKQRIVHRTAVGCWPRGAYEPVSLPTVRELRRLFPGADVAGLSFTMIPETLIVWHRE